MGRRPSGWTFASRQTRQDLLRVAHKCSTGFQPVSGSAFQSLGTVRRDPNLVVSSEAAQCESNTVAVLPGAEIAGCVWCLHAQCAAEFDRQCQ